MYADILAINHFLSLCVMLVFLSYAISTLSCLFSLKSSAKEGPVIHDSYIIFDFRWISGLKHHHVMADQSQCNIWAPSKSLSVTFHLFEACQMVKKKWTADKKDGGSEI